MSASSPNISQRPAERRYLKCQQCRRGKKKCKPADRIWPQKCNLCIQRKFPCSEPCFASDEQDAHSAILQTQHQPERSSSSPQATIFQGIPDTVEALGMLKQNCARISNIVTAIENSTTAHEHAIDDMQHTATSSITSGMNDPVSSASLITLQQALELKCVGSEIQRLIHTATIGIDTPVDSPAVQDHDAFMSSATASNAEEDQGEFGGLFSEESEDLHSAFNPQYN